MVDCISTWLIKIKLVIPESFGIHIANWLSLSSIVHWFIFLADGSHFSCDSLVYDTLLPKEAIEVRGFEMECVIALYDKQ